MELGFAFEKLHPQGALPADVERLARSWAVRPDRLDAPAQRQIPEWSALRARFEALHAFRRALASAVDALPPAGSFTESGHSVLDWCREQGGSVNPVCSANGKAPPAILPDVAAFPTTGDRGME